MAESGSVLVAIDTFGAPGHSPARTPRPRPALRFLLSAGASGLVSRACPIPCIRPGRQQYSALASCPGKGRASPSPGPGSPPCPPLGGWHSAPWGPRPGEDASVRRVGPPPVLRSSLRSGSQSATLPGTALRSSLRAGGWSIARPGHRPCQVRGQEPAYLVLRFEPPATRPRRGIAHPAPASCLLRPRGILPCIVPRNHAAPPSPNLQLRKPRLRR